MNFSTAQTLPIEQARLFKDVAPMSAALSKRLLWDTARNGYGPERVAELETDLHLRVMGSADAAEGVRAYRDRREPQWSARLSQYWKELPVVDRGRPQPGAAA